jgi:multidrug efflux pump subunit AcrA (membrane-fusion protein)
VHIDVRVDGSHPLVPGINGEVIIIVGRRPARTVVPRRAVFELDGKCVFVVHNGVVEARKVGVGYVWARGAEILSGLEPGETVIVDELENFRPGDKVRIRELPSDVEGR